MRTDIVRVYKSVHTWTGIVAGLILFVAFYAGALTMFKEPLDRWIAPPAPYSKAGLERASELIAGALAMRPEAAKDFSLVLAETDGKPLHVTWQQGRIDPNPWSATLAPDGAIEVAQLDPSGIGLLVDVVHRTAGIPGDLDIGTMVTGIASALYVVALVSGVIILLPSLVKDFFALRLGRNVKRMWLDAHNIVGIVSLPFHIVIALSAVVFGLHDQFYDSLDHVVYEGRMRAVMEASSPLRKLPKDAGPAAMLPATELLARARAFAPDFEPSSLQYQRFGTGGALVRVWGEDPRYLVRNHGFLVMSPVTGAVVDTDYMPGHQGTWSAVVSSFFSLHFGSFGGGLIRWSYFLLGLAGAFLFYSGNLLWVETRRKTERRGGGPVTQSRSTALMAAGTVGVCLGCMAGLSLTIAAGKWLHGSVENLNAWHHGVYYAVFLGACAWAFGRGAARAGVELLWLTAAATAAIPATTLLAWALPWLGLTSSGHEPGVDLTALAGAFLLARMAQAARCRAREGASDSVWSAVKEDGFRTREAAQPAE